MVGNALVDTFLQIHDANIHCRLDEKECKLCVTYGQKILVDTARFVLGGGACNVSVGLARLGFSTGLVAEIGSDEFSEKIIKLLTQEKVDTTGITKTKDTASSFSIGITFKGERTLFVRHVQRSHNFQFDNINSKWVYLGGLGKEWKKAYQQTLDFARQNNIKLAFAPGTTQIEEGAEGISEIIKKADMLFVNKEEAMKVLSSKYKVVSIKEILEGLKSLGSKIVVITDGKNGSYVIDQDEKLYSMGVYDVPIIEKTGAGDGYASGFLGALLSNFSIEEAMRWGSYNAASVIGKIGAQAGLLSKEELEVQLNNL